MRPQVKRLGEATRQYQRALEAARTMREQIAGCVSCDDERDEIAAVVEAKAAVMFAAWMNH